MRVTTGELTGGGAWAHVLYDHAHPRAEDIAKSA
jgi:hypothetical protein